MQFLSKQKYWLLILIFAYCLADIMIISLRPLFLSNKVPPHSPVFDRSRKTVSAAEYMPIWDFNVFHNAAIPPSLSSIGEEESTQNTNPLLSRLPLQLNGTIVYRNPTYSMANITIKKKKISESYQVDDAVDSLARITEITSDRVYFINLNNNIEEYIEVQNLHNISFDFKRKNTPLKKTNKESGFIKSIGDFKFQVNRSDINKHLRHLPNILRDAKVIPHWEKGKMVGFRFKYIKAGSIYEQLGFKVSDIIISVAGERPRSQLHAAELFQRFKNRTSLDIIVKRKGKDIAFSWLINEDTSIEEPPRSRFY